MTADLIHKMDTDGNGVTEVEFLCWCLVEFGKASESDIQAILCKFHDADKSPLLRAGRDLMFGGSHGVFFPPAGVQKFRTPCNRDAAAVFSRHQTASAEVATGS